MVAVTDILSRIALPGVLFIDTDKGHTLFFRLFRIMYIMLCFLALFIWLVLRGGLKISYTYIPFLVALFISIWVNEIPAYFKVWFRGLAFLSVVFAVGPFFVNPYMVTWRRLLFVYALAAIRWIVVISFLGGYSGCLLYMDTVGFVD